MKCFSAILLAAGFGLPPLATAAEYAVGADLSFLKQAEDRGVVFKDEGVARPGLQIFRDHGYNWIRLRLFHSPSELPNNLEYTLAVAKAAKALGFKFLLNFHYSDTWADPGKQFVPKAWEGKSHSEMVQAVFEYTRDTVARFRAENVLPDMVQVGNEITNGMLWPLGKLPDQWDQFAEYLRAGIAGVRAGAASETPPRIMIHIDRGGDRHRTKSFFDRLHSYQISYDVIGQSYYPGWHGNLLDLWENLVFMALEYKREIIIVETGYSHRPPPTGPRPAPFPETPEGQKEFLQELQRIVMMTPNGLGRGVFWWEPAVRPGNPRGFFDQDGNALPVITVFDRYTRDTRRRPQTGN
jgi:arabinogalactan endo-1,4-beta-galactosidase